MALFVVFREGSVKMLKAARWSWRPFGVVTMLSEGYIVVLWSRQDPWYG